MYKTDKEIAQEFKGFKIVNITVNKSLFSGSIEIDFPNAEEHVGGGTDSVCDSWIKYDSGKIAFDHWYTDEVYFALVNAINNKLDNYNN